MHFVLLNGPPRCGKDTAALALERHFAPKMNFIWEKFSFPLKTAFAGMMKCEIDDYGNVEHFEANKGEIIYELNCSYRQWQIDFSEKFMKPLYGQPVFANLLLGRITNNEGLCVISDCGFQVEVDTIASHFPKGRCLLIRIDRPGCTFDGDSREWVEPSNGANFVNIYNHFEVAWLEREVCSSVEMWLNAQKQNA